MQRSGRENDFVPDASLWPLDDLRERKGCRSGPIVHTLLSRPRLIAALALFLARPSGNRESIATEVGNVVPKGSGCGSSLKSGAAAEPTPLPSVSGFFGAQLTRRFSSCGLSLAAS